MDEASRKKYEQEIRRLDDEFAELQRSWGRTPYFALFGLLAPACWYLYGVSAALIELLVTAALVGTRCYLIGVRKSENRWTRKSVAREVTREPESKVEDRAHGIWGYGARGVSVPGHRE